MARSTEKKGLSVKDLVMVGVFTAAYFVTFFISASTGIFPIMTVLFPALSAFISGIPMILFFSKVHSFGMVTILCTASGLINFAMGFGFQSIFVALICGFLADIILKAGRYKSWKAMMVAYIVFSEWAVGTMLPMWVATESYFETARQVQGEEFVAKTLPLITGWMIPVVIVAIAIAAIFGTLLGRRVLQKHFIKAGIV